MTKKWIYRILLIVSIVITLVSAVSLGKYYGSSYVNDQKQKDASNIFIMQKEQSNMAAPDADTEAAEAENIRAHYDELLEKYPDYIGWISVPGTKISYPVMQHIGEGTDYFYLNHDYEGQENSSGSIFMNENCNPETKTDNLLIYGHNMKSGTMFHDLLKYEDKSFAENTYITFNSIHQDGLYKVVAAFRTRVSDDEPSSDTFFRYYEYIDLSDKAMFESYMEICKRLSLYDMDVDVQYGDELITLSTCSYGQQDGSERFVVVAKKLDI